MSWILGSRWWTCIVLLFNFMRSQNGFMFYFSLLLLPLVRNMQSWKVQSIVYLEGLQCSFSVSYKNVLAQWYVCCTGALCCRLIFIEWVLTSLISSSLTANTSHSSLSACHAFFSGVADVNPVTLLINDFLHKYFSRIKTSGLEQLF